MVRMVVRRVERGGRMVVLLATSALMCAVYRVLKWAVSGCSRWIVGNNGSRRLKVWVNVGGIGMCSSVSGAVYPRSGRASASFSLDQYKQGQGEQRYSQILNTE